MPKETVHEERARRRQHHQDHKNDPPSKEEQAVQHMENTKHKVAEDAEGGFFCLDCPWETP